jgi:molybdopterin molybdotransferase
VAVEVETARQYLLDTVRCCGPERYKLINCWDRILAEDITADSASPPFDQSLLDGYAVISLEVERATPEQPVMLEQIDYIPAGSVGKHAITWGQTARIMTGAPIPSGANGIVRLEDTKCAGTHITILAGAGAAKNICRQGEEFAQGEVVLHRGTRLNAGAMGMLATLGQTEPLVYRHPRVGILATGSEIIDVDQPLTPGKIRNSNSFMLQAQVFEAGGEPVLLGGIEDDIKLICNVLQAAPVCDIYITTGGASVGDYDLMGQVFDKLGVKVIFNRVAMKPGKQIFAGSWQEALLVGLSGNPAAASVSFEVLVRPVIRKMAGHAATLRPMIRAVLKTDFRGTSTARRFVWGQCSQGPLGWEATPIAYQRSGILKSMVSANALIVIPPGTSNLLEGSEVDVMLLEGIGHRA